MTSWEGKQAVNPDMITLARESRALTQSELAVQMGVTQGKVSKLESGLLHVSGDDLRRLASVLDYPEHMFTWTDTVYGFAGQELFHRKRQKASASALAAIHAEVNLCRMRIERLLRSAEIDARDGFRYIDPDEFDGDVASIARAVRAAWMLPDGPIANLTEAIEDAGAIIISEGFRSPHVDAVSQWAPKLPPILFVNLNIPADRLRFTLAHEVGHLIMHRVVSPNAETEADQFAAEFLMPAKDIRHELSDLTMPALATLKLRWKVSMQALLMRARTLGTISEQRAIALWRKMSSLGYRKNEPAVLPREEPHLYRDLLRFYLTELDYSETDLGSAIGHNHVGWLVDPDKPRLSFVARKLDIA